jgi:hypothetical protein
MSKPMPPVPPAGRTDKGPGSSPESAKDDQAVRNGAVPENLAEQDRQGDIKQNTTNQGYQQDR